MIENRDQQIIDYKKAMLLFYEQNNLSNFKEIFINDGCAIFLNTYKIGKIQKLSIGLMKILYF